MSLVIIPAAGCVASLHLVMILLSSDALNLDFCLAFAGVKSKESYML